MKRRVILAAAAAALSLSFFGIAQGGQDQAAIGNGIATIAAASADTTAPPAPQPQPQPTMLAAANTGQGQPTMLAAAGTTSSGGGAAPAPADDTVAFGLTGKQLVYIAAGMVVGNVVTGGVWISSGWHAFWTAVGGWGGKKLADR